MHDRAIYMQVDSFDHALGPYLQCELHYFCCLKQSIETERHYHLSP